KRYRATREFFAQHRKAGVGVLQTATAGAFGVHGTVVAQLPQFAKQFVAEITFFIEPRRFGHKALVDPTRNIMPKLIGLGAHFIYIEYCCSHLTVSCDGRERPFFTYCTAAA